LFLSLSNKKKEKEKQKKVCLFFSTVAVSEKVLLASVIDRTTLVLEHTQAYRKEAITPALNPSHACAQAHCKLVLDCTYLHSSALPKISLNRLEAVK
jgi:hypothetical protein